MVEANAVFVTQYLFATLFQTRRSLGVTLSRSLDGLDGKRHIGGKNQHIVARHECHVRHTVLLHFLRDALHIKAIGENQALKAHSLFQQFGDHTVG